MRPLGWAALLLLTTCARTFEPPQSQPLEAGPVPNLAPQEAAILSAGGGAGHYRWSFDADGMRSGPDAVLEPDGHYRAGSVGNNADLVQVRDAAGATVHVEINVGQRLSVAPAAASVAPRGQVQFVVAGGKPPYAFAFVGAQSCNVPDAHGSGVGADESPTLENGVYQAGSGADAVDCLQVSDATADDAGIHAAVEVPIAVGHGLAISPEGPLDAFPHQSIDLLALGGAPPYHFSLGGNGLGCDAGGSCIDDFGHYVASSAGDVDDTVVLTDHNEVQVSVQVKVGPALSASLGSDVPRPGAAVAFFASGGEPPYRFDFAPKGNRSDGSIAPTGTGQALYTPGPNSGTNDILSVTDASGATAQVRTAPIGPRTFAAGSASRIVAGDFDGDGLADLAMADTLDVTARSQIQVVRAAGSATPHLDSYSRGPLVLDLAAADLDRDGFDDLIISRDGRLEVAYADFSGALSAPVPLLGISAITSSLRPAPLLAEGVDGTGTVWVLNGGTLDAPADAGCPGIDGGALVALSFDGARTPSSVSCTPINRTTIGAAVGDFFFDGGAQFAWLDAFHLQVASSLAGSSLTFNLDGGRVSNNGSTEGALLVLHGNGAREDLLVARRHDDDPDGGERLYVVDARTGVVGPPFHVPFTRSVQGMAAHADLAADPEDTLFIWDGASPSALELSVADGGALQVVGETPPAPVQISGFSSADLDGDGLRDAVFSSVDVPSSGLLFGPGALGFGQNLRFVHGGPFLVQLDIDGDGLDDLLDVGSDGTVQALFGGEHQLAYGPVTSAPLPVGAQTHGHFLADAGELLMLGYSQGGADLFEIDPSGALLRKPPPSDAGWVVDASGNPVSGPFPKLARAQFGGATGEDAWSYQAELLPDGSFGIEGEALIFTGDGPAHSVLGPPLEVVTAGDCDMTGVRFAGSAFTNLVAACHARDGGVYVQSLDFDGTGFTSSGTLDALGAPAGEALSLASFSTASLDDAPYSYFVIRQVPQGGTEILGSTLVRVGADGAVNYALPAELQVRGGMRLGLDGGVEAAVLRTIRGGWVVQLFDDGGYADAGFIQDLGSPVRLSTLAAGAPPDVVFNEPDGVLEMVVHQAVDGGWR